MLTAVWIQALQQDVYKRQSLCSLPILTSQFGLNDEALAKAGVTRGMMRLSVGLEDAADLIADLRQAIED